jgi:hypothetical protein
LGKGTDEIGLASGGSIGNYGSFKGSDLSSCHLGYCVLFGGGSIEVDSVVTDIIVSPVRSDFKHIGSSNEGLILQEGHGLPVIDVGAGNQNTCGSVQRDSGIGTVLILAGIGVHSGLVEVQANENVLGAGGSECEVTGITCITSDFQSVMGVAGIVVPNAESVEDFREGFYINKEDTIFQ